MAIDMKTVLITGANRGLGKALNDAFTQNGWTTISTARKPDAKMRQLDLADENSVIGLATQIKSEKITIDMIINSAGMNPKDVKIDGYFDSTFYLEHFSPSNIAESLYVNSLMPMLLISRLMPSFAPDGVVLNISSWLGSMNGKNVPGHYAYSGSKALLNMFTRGMAMEFEGTQRSAVAINPGWMRTDMGGDNAETTPSQVATQLVEHANKNAFLACNGSFRNVDLTEHLW